MAHVNPLVSIIRSIDCYKPQNSKARVVDALIVLCRKQDLETLASLAESVVSNVHDYTYW